LDAEEVWHHSKNSVDILMIVYFLKSAEHLM